VSRRQYASALQSASAQQPFAGTHVLPLQVADWHWSAIAAEQLWPFARPQVWFAPHTPTAHSDAPAQATPFALAQVLLTGLHNPALHTDWATGAEQTGACNVSSGSAWPAARSATQVNVPRSQCWFAAQSASAQHPSERKGTQAPLALQLPDWQLPALAAVHPGWPLARPHLPLVPHTLSVHCAALAQSNVTAAAQVFAVELQTPEAQAGEVPPAPQ
jgi:hypothetical protein